jgi:hypothetical protein
MAEWLALGSRPLFAGTPFCEANGGRPRPGPATFTVARRCGSSHLAARLARIVKMPRIRFYNRRSRNEHPQQHHLWRPRRLPWVKPPATSSRILRTRRFRRTFVKDAGPPCGHPASNGRAFDGARPASDRSATATALSRDRGGEMPQLYRLTTNLPRRASDTRWRPLEFSSARPGAPLGTLETLAYSFGGLAGFESFETRARPAVAAIGAGQ